MANSVDATPPVVIEEEVPVDREETILARLPDTYLVEENIKQKNRLLEMQEEDDTRAAVEDAVNPPQYAQSAPTERLIKSWRESGLIYKVRDTPIQGRPPEAPPMSRAPVERLRTRRVQSRRVFEDDDAFANAVRSVEDHRLLDNVVQPAEEGPVTYAKEELQSMARVIGKEEGLNPDHVEIYLKLIGAESGWDITAESHRGAKGLGQLMDNTGKSLIPKGTEYTPFDPEQNLRGSAKYLAKLIKRFGSIEKALAAYNAGPTAVEKHGGVPPFKETQRYVASILGDNG